MPISTNRPAISDPLGEPSLQEIVGLLALLEKTQDPLRFRTIPMFPAEFLEKEVYSALQSRKLIWPDNTSAIQVAADWKIVKTFKNDVLQYSRSNHWPARWVTESKDLWIKLAAAECTEFFKLCLAERHVELDDESMVYENLKTFFPKYSVGQCYFFIFIGAKDMSDVIQKGYSGKKSKTQLMLDSCFKCEDYYHKKRKKVSNFRRHPKLPASLLHTIFHTQFFTHGEEGFNSPPHCFVSGEKSFNAK